MTIVLDNCLSLPLEFSSVQGMVVSLIAVAHVSLAGMLLFTFKKSDTQMRPLVWLSSASLLFWAIAYTLPLAPINLSVPVVILEVMAISPLGWLSLNAISRSNTGGTGTSPQQLEKINQKLEHKIAEREQVEQSLRLTAQKLQQSLEYEALLKQITDQVRDSLDEKHILQTAVRALGEGLDVRSCNAALYDLTSKTAIVHYEYTTSFAPVQGRVMSMDNAPWLYDQLLTGQHFQFCSLFPNPSRGRVSMLVCPIIDDNGVLGDLWLVNHADYGFNELESRLIQQVTNQCAIAIRQARLYQESQSQVKELKRLNQLKNDFLSTVSHELRTPVANVKLATRMLGVTLARRAEAFEDPSIFAQPDELVALDQKVREKELYYLKVLEDECQREINLVNDLLDLQRLEEDKAPLPTEEIDLDEWLPKAVKPFENRASSRNQTLELQVPDSLDLMQSDPVSLGRIITELVNNACKYTPPEERIIVEANTDGNVVRFMVTNSGVEIPARELSHIFEKFYRVPSTDPWKQGGTGLGLALIKTLVEHLGGTISVVSQSNQTCFTVELPLYPGGEELVGTANAIQVVHTL
ncbi:MAG: GAF domain-containing sensor histidine kinase [Symploca sp. SIO2B6]|nr:GAF domain-containing sensor histidine kinase [Symploca sp. SIO2B6]